LYEQTVFLYSIPPSASENADIFEKIMVGSDAWPASGDAIKAEGSDPGFQSQASK
jgi:hypothetical protein